MTAATVPSGWVNDVFAAGSITRQNQVTVTGQEADGLVIPADGLETRAIPTGTQHHTLTSGQQLTLEPGTYGDMHLHDGASLSLVEGVYNFRKLVLEAGTTTLRFAPGSGFIEINAEQELRFGDRNQFVLEGGTSPTQVQFYTNSTQQVKVGTDSVFNGVITAPNAQVYVFSRVEFNGALYGKSVWIDTDTRVNLYPNCTEYHMEMEEYSRATLCGGLVFESTGVTVVTGDPAAIELNGLFASVGHTSLRFHSETDTHIELELKSNIRMPFTGDGTPITVQLDALSDGAFVEIDPAELRLRAKVEGDGAFQDIGVFSYGQNESGTGTFTTFTATLPQNLSDSLRAGASLRLRIALTVPHPEVSVWLDHLRFCSSEDGCNPGCPEPEAPQRTVPPPREQDLSLRFLNEDQDRVSGLSSLSGTIANQTLLEEYTIEAVLHFTNPFNQRQSHTVFDGTVQPQESVTFSLPASQIPFADEDGVNQVMLKILRRQDGMSVPTDYAHTRYYRHNNTTGTVAHFNHSALIEHFDGILYRLSADSVPGDGADARVVQIRFGSIPLSTLEALSDTDGADTDSVAIPID